MITVSAVVLALAGAALDVDPAAPLLVVLLALLQATAASSTTPSAAPVLAITGTLFISDSLILIISCPAGAAWLTTPQ